MKFLGGPFGAISAALVTWHWRGEQRHPYCNSPSQQAGTHVSNITEDKNASSEVEELRAILQDQENMSALLREKELQRQNMSEWIATLTATLEDRQQQIVKLEPLADAGVQRALPGDVTVGAAAERNDTVTYPNVNEKRVFPTGDPFYALVESLRRCAILVEDLSIFAWEGMAAQLLLWPSETSTETGRLHTESSRLPQFERQIWETVASLEEVLTPHVQDSAGYLRTCLHTGFESARNELINHLPAGIWTQLSGIGKSSQNKTDAVVSDMAHTVASLRAYATGIVDAFLLQYPEHGNALRERDPIWTCLLIAGIFYLAVQQLVAVVVYIWRWTTLVAKTTLFAAHGLMKLLKSCCCCIPTSRAKPRQKASAKYQAVSVTTKRTQADSATECSETHAESLAAPNGGA